MVPLIPPITAPLTIALARPSVIFLPSQTFVPALTIPLVADPVAEPMSAEPPTVPIVFFKAAAAALVFS